MPTKKPRFLVTIEPDHHRALKALAGLSGKSVSALINEMLAPQLKPFLAIVANIERDPRQTNLIEALETSVSSVEAFMQQVGGLMDLSPLNTSESEKKRPHKEAVGGASTRASIPRSASVVVAPEAPERTDLTPASNTGVTIPKGRRKLPKMVVGKKDLIS